jgi:hypothetical protein
MGGRGWNRHTITPLVYCSDNALPPDLDADPRVLRLASFFSCRLGSNDDFRIAGLVVVYLSLIGDVMKCFVT